MGNGKTFHFLGGWEYYIDKVWSELSLGKIGKPFQNGIASCEWGFREQEIRPGGVDGL